MHYRRRPLLPDKVRLGKRSTLWSTRDSWEGQPRPFSMPHAPSYAQKGAAHVRQQSRQASSHRRRWLHPPGLTQSGVAHECDTPTRGPTRARDVTVAQALCSHRRPAFCCWVLPPATLIETLVRASSDRLELIASKPLGMVVRSTQASTRVHPRPFPPARPIVLPRKLSQAAVAAEARAHTSRRR